MEIILITNIQIYPTSKAKEVALKKNWSNKIDLFIISQIFDFYILDHLFSIAIFLRNSSVYH